MKTRDHVAGLIAFFRARKGKAYGFRFKDWTDYQGTAQPLGVGDGATKTFQLTKIYASGGAVEARTIAKPVAGTVIVYKGGVAATGWTVDTTAGVVTFTTALANGVVVTADFEFDVPARFDSPFGYRGQMDIIAETYDLARWAQTPVVELRL